MEYTAPEILFTLPNPNPYPTWVLTNLNFRCCVFQVVRKSSLTHTHSISSAKQSGIQTVCSHADKVT